MNFIPDWAPNIHPMLVHFPIVLLIFALLFDFLGLIWNRGTNWRNGALLLYGFGLLAVAVTYVFGRQAADQIRVAESVLPAVSEHADWAARVLWFWIGFVVLRFGIALRRLDFRRPLLALFLLAAVIGNYLIYGTAERGARLVYNFGVGVQPQQSAVPSPSAEETFPDGIFRAKENEVFWQIGGDALSVLQTRLSWQPSSLDSVRVQVLQDTAGAVLAIRFQDARATLLLPGKFSDVSLETDLNLDGFTGRIFLVQHLLDDRFFDFLELSRNRLILGRQLEDRTKKLGEKEIPVSGWATFKLVSTSGHFRGFVNGEMALHSHDKERPPGKVGLLLDGTGTVKIREIRAVRLTAE